ncbi:hypothetical protein Tsubulata_021353 [Turnera subulata]|uniref:TF-B3 domain-containing protein n=1 Tax=Turnera subulata TaxID=218843 RepID=A0A9Q0JIM9_9ROSI|nr:hypothetical protein Tsubulata_021353 [Turnera subulata]
MERKNTRSNTKRDITLFFEIVFPLTVGEKMRIPKKFAMRNGGELQDVAKLFLPNGRVWKLRIRRKGEEEIYLTEGWLEFLEHYSLHNDHFLIFKYKGRSNFKVRIFDVSGSEMQYPPVEMDETSDSGEETNTSKKIRRQAGPSRAYKTGENKGSIQFTFKPYKLRNASLETLEAVHEAEKLETRGPSFTVLLSKTDMHNHDVSVPVKFAETYLTEGDNDTVQIESLEGRQWDLGLCYARGRYTLRVGWAEFARDNHLKAGDVLVFELLNRRHVALQCTIFRAGSMTRREFPVFCIPILQDMNPRIPLQFMSHYGNELADAATLILPNGQVWEIGLSKGLDETFLDNGWLEFAENYSIGIGHFLYFKYKGQSRFKVHIFDKSCCEIRSLRRATKDVGSSRANIRPIQFGITTYKFNRASLASQKAVREAGKYETRNPSFVVLLGNREMTRFQWFVPVKFAETYLIHIGKDTKAINIKGSDGTQWQLQICKVNQPTRDRFFQIRGCSGITAGYDLKIGDALLLELLDVEDALLQLNIFRAH